MPSSRGIAEMPQIPFSPGFIREGFGLPQGPAGHFGNILGAEPHPMPWASRFPELGEPGADSAKVRQ